MLRVAPRSTLDYDEETIASAHEFVAARLADQRGWRLVGLIH